MIEFACEYCGTLFNVPDAAAGKKARCKCGSSILVPDSMPDSIPDFSNDNLQSPPSINGHNKSAHSANGSSANGNSNSDTSSTVATTAGPKLPMRTRRLMADSRNMIATFSNFDLIKIKSTTGDPAEIYQIEYHIKSYDRGKKNPVLREHHIAEIQLTSDYPRMAPKCRLLTPIFHPNIDSATICVGDHWTAGERLVDLVIRIGEILAYQAYNIKSPLDAEAAMWADLNGDKLPVDTRNLRPPEMDI